MRITKKIIAAAASAALACSMFGLVGCAGDDSASNTQQEITTADINAQDIEVTNVGYTVLGDGTLSYAFTVNNPNEGYIADGVTFTIEAYDADDMMVVGGGETIHQIYPNFETAAAGTSYLVEGTEIARFEVQPLMEHVRWTKTSEDASALAAKFNVSDIEITNPDGQTDVAGTISCDLGSSENSGDGGTSMIDARESAQITILFLDADGNIICGGESSSIMLDPSMTLTNVAPTGVDEDGNPVYDEAAATPATSDENAGNVVSTSFNINIPGTFGYDSYKILVAPSI